MSHIGSFYITSDFSWRVNAQHTSKKKYTTSEGLNQVFQETNKKRGKMQNSLECLRNETKGILYNECEGETAPC